MESGRNIVEKILQRYDRYSQYLSYPGDWGERALRGWLAYELFHSFLGWPIENIVFGERFDVLFIDESLKPVINLETKKPNRGLSNYEDFISRLPDYQTIIFGILTDGFDWLRLNCLDNTELKIDINMNQKYWEDFLRPLFSKRFLYGVEYE